MISNSGTLPLFRVCLVSERLAPFPDTPRAAFSLHTGNIDISQLPEQCPNITEFTFDPNDTPELEYPIRVALGYTSMEAKAAVYSDMARRMAGQRTLCGVTPNKDDISVDPEDGEEEPVENSGSLAVVFRSVPTSMIALAILFLMV